MKYALILFICFSVASATMLRHELDDLIDELNHTDSDTDEIGELIDNPNLIDKLIQLLQGNVPTVLSPPDDFAECFYEKETCVFELTENPVFFEIDFIEDEPEYELTIQQEGPTGEIQRRRLKDSNCAAFKKALSLWNRDISCEIKEYFHIIKITNL